MAFSITVMGVGSRHDRVADDVTHYLKMIKPYASINLDLSKPINMKNGNLVREKECGILISRIPKNSFATALTDEARLLSSSKFASWISGRQQSGMPLIFVLGGAYGLTDELKLLCQDRISLSPLTFPYKLCLTILLEQVYRAFTILKGHPYHKG